ncbi:hypothetical protein DFP72DRAFT_1003355 [Ephemerocybe angulata]|uniref:RRM Nup35-type domain-containing protein n=1 Tax=Ephemerocybe angulata TaxID=980116 RepID=A0A8H6ME64_9AGAR|nr:hypothetical protein DFP72DRAFT_1003355 [Tulosesus angulatus]
MQNSHFNPGMSTSTSSHHTPNLNTWGTSSTSTSFGDSLSQSRSHYQSGYLMSATQSTNSPQGNQRTDEAPIVPTKAKLNQVLTRGPASDFGMESMFESTSRQRQTLADEDAPPMSSVNDIPNEVLQESTSTRFQPRQSTLHGSQFGSKRHTKVPPVAPTNEQCVYVIVFGYPPDRQATTAEYFQALGGVTGAETIDDLRNAFRMGFQNLGDAARAVRKNGEVLQKEYMIGVKFFDQTQAESILGQPSARGNLQNDSMNIDEPVQSPFPFNSTPNLGFGTPIKLEPSAAAFRRPGAPGGQSKPTTPQASAASSWASPLSAVSGGGAASSPSLQASGSNKSMLGQVSDLIFGW